MRHPLSGWFKPLAKTLLFFAVAVPLWAKPDHVVLGYSAYWFDDIYPPSSYNYDALTHIARAFLLPLPNGGFQVANSYFDPVLAKEAKAHGVKLLASVGGGAWSSENWMVMAQDNDRRKKFFDELDKLLTAHGYDGVDIDWEPGPLTDKEQATYTGFMKALRARFPHWVITTALAPGDYFAKHVSWKELSACVDYLNMMTYDFAGSWTGHTSFAAQLYPSSVAGHNSGLSDDEAMTQLESKYGVKPGQMLMGLPFYGQIFFAPDLGSPWPKTSPTDTSLEYYEISPLVMDKGFAHHWDATAQEPYLVGKNGMAAISYDDVEATTAKCNYVSKKGLAGVIIWNLGADVDAGKTPLMDAVATSFGAKVQRIQKEDLARVDGAFTDIVHGAWDNLMAQYRKLDAAGKTEDSKKADPGPNPTLRVHEMSPEGKTVDMGHLQKKLADLEQKFFVARSVVAELPAPKVVAESPAFKDGKFLVDDFESSTQPGEWSVEKDNYHLGSVVNPVPFALVTGGCPDSSGHAARFWGHLGTGREPNPKAQLVCHLAGDGKALDLTGAKGIVFWVKGDGAIYHVSLAQAAVQDEAYYGSDFVTESQWKKVEIPFSKLAQPWGSRVVTAQWSDIQSLIFSPSNATGDIDFDVTFDQVAFYR